MLVEADFAGAELERVTFDDCTLARARPGCRSRCCPASPC
ncbi:hypothetical protein [Streptomyces decoyicus]